MDFERILPVCSLVFFAMIVIFALSKSHAYKGIDELQVDNGQKSLFFYQQQEYPRDCRNIHNRCSASNSSGVFSIKPDGYAEPFEVYCDNVFQFGGWTVIQRRIDGSVVFNRDWQEYENGFGFLATEFWLGNEKLSYLTNQAKYELRIDLTLSNGTELYASYSAFRISDEWSQYSLVDTGNFDGNIDLTCPTNMIFGNNCLSQPSCDYPSGVKSYKDNCTGETEVCVCLNGFLMKDDKCVLPSECGCYLTEINSVLQTGETFVNIDCTKKCTCRDGTLSCNTNYRCDSNAACLVQDGIRDCVCNEHYIGDGESCTLLKDCYDLHKAGYRQDGVYTILPTGWSETPFSVYCDMTTAGGGWTLFQRRIDGVTDFYRDWAAYKQGFGSVQEGNDFWLGNEQLHYLTNQTNYKLRVDIVDSGGSSHYAEYTTFQIGDKATKYRLTINGHSGDTDDGMKFSSGGSFSTYDRDNDGCSYHDCAELHRGAWWYKAGGTAWCQECFDRLPFCNNFPTRSGCNNACTRSNLNGNYNGGNGRNINWLYFHYCNLNSAEMKIRPSSA